MYIKDVEALYSGSESALFLGGIVQVELAEEEEISNG